MCRLWACWLGISFCLLCCEPNLTAQTELERAIQVVRNWLGDPKAPVTFLHEDKSSIDLFGPRMKLCFKAPLYTQIYVDLSTMKVVSWTREHTVQGDRPLLSDDEIKKIAYNYAQQNFPHFSEYRNWDISIFKFKLRTPTGGKAWSYSVDLFPYFINDQGQKVPCLTTHCGVGIDPYTGEVYGFGYNYMPMTLKSLTPNFSPSEAKTLIEQAFMKLGASKATAVMSSTDDPIFIDMPDGLVIGATQTSGMRLAYAFDYVVTVGAPGHEDEFGTTKSPARWHAAIDAHTGELFYREYWLGIEEFGEGLGMIGNLIRWIAIGFVAIVCLLILFTYCKLRRLRASRA